MQDIRPVISPSWPRISLAVALYAALAALLLWRWDCSYISSDGAVCGLLGIAALHGRWPLFFFGQNFMGALDGYLAAPIYALFGPSTLTLNIWPPVLYLATVAVLHACLRRLFNPVAALAGLAYLCLPTAVGIFHPGNPQNHYALGHFLGALVILITFRLRAAKSWGLALPFFWGLIAGLGMWTNFLTGVVILPCAVFLLASRLRSCRPLPVLIAAAGLALGAGPLLYYNLTHGLVHTGQAQYFAWHYGAEHIKLLFKNALPLLLGFNTPAAKGSAQPGSYLFVLYLLALLLLIVAGLVLIKKAWREKEPLFTLPLLVVLSSLLAAVFSIYGRGLKDWDVRYLLPVYLGLPFFWAALVEAFTRNTAWAALPLCLLLAAGHLSAYPGFLDGFYFCHGKGWRITDEPGIRDYVKYLRQAGFGHYYLLDPDKPAFLAAESPQMANPWEEKRQYAAVAVDAALNPAFAFDLRSSLSLLGVSGKNLDSRIFHSFAEPQGAAGLASRQGWRCQELGGRDLGNLLFDGDLTTGFRIGREGDGLALDLGREQTLAGLCLVQKDSRETPSGLVLELAGQDGQFRKVREEANYMGPCYWSGPHLFIKLRYPRVECYFPPQPVRFARLRHLGKIYPNRPWQVREILAFGPGAEPSPASWAETGRLLSKHLLARGVKRLYADAWPSAYVAHRLGGRVATVPANLFTDDYGRRQPPLDQPPWLDPGSGGVVVVENRQAEITSRALANWGVDFETLQAGRLTLFALKGLARRGALPLKAVSSPADPEAARQLARGRPAAGRWGSQRPQSPDVHLDIDLGRMAAVAAVTLACPDHPQDYPRGLRAEVSEDGANWRPATLGLAGPLAFCGPTLFACSGPVVSYGFTPLVKTRFIRLRPARSDPHMWWSVQELKVWGPRG